MQYSYYYFKGALPAHDPSSQQAQQQFVAGQFEAGARFDKHTDPKIPVSFLTCYKITVLNDIVLYCLIGMY